MDQFEYTLDELPEIASEIIRTRKSKTLLFYGKMGVGKTTLIKELVKQLGSDDVVSSPTFSLVNEYAAEDVCLYHFDFYRIEDEMEALDMGIEEYLDSGNWIFIEWPEKIAGLLPDECQAIHIERKNQRNILKMG